jgi:hypothetical protein
MPMTAAQICQNALRIAKAPGWISGTQTGQILNSILAELCQNYDFDAAKGTYQFNFDPGATGGVLENPTPGAGPFNMPSDFLRADKGDVMWFLLGVPYPMIPLDPAEYNQQVQQAGLSSYPYWFTVLVDQSPPEMYIWPPTSGTYPAQVVYRRQMPDIATPETSSTVPWFVNQNYLITRLAGEMMKMTDDSRWKDFLGDGPQGAQGIMNRYLKMVDDHSDRSVRVSLDRRRFGPRFSLLNNTKTIGW